MICFNHDLIGNSFLYLRFINVFRTFILTKFINAAFRRYNPLANGLLKL